MGREEGKAGKPNLIHIFANTLRFFEHCHDAIHEIFFAWFRPFLDRVQEHFASRGGLQLVEGVTSLPIREYFSFWMPRTYCNGFKYLWRHRSDDEKNSFWLQNPPHLCHIGSGIWRRNAGRFSWRCWGVASTANRIQCTFIQNHFKSLRQIIGHIPRICLMQLQRSYVFKQ